MKKKNVPLWNYDGKHVWFYAVTYFLLILNTLILSIALWVKNTFSISVTTMVYTAFGNKTGTGRGVVDNAVLYCLPFVFFAILVGSGIIVLNARVKTDVKLKTKHPFSFSEFFETERAFVAVLLAVYFCFNVFYVDNRFRIVDYLKTKSQTTDFYENNYVDPRNVAVTNGGDKRNLIYIYLESMESSAASVEDGGLQKDNCIPNLTQMAKENVSFSDTEKLGGAMQLSTTSWTMAALFATGTGVPWAFPIKANEYSEMNFEFASGIYGLGDFLQDQGYSQEFLCGSDIRFAGRDKYFKAHGDYEIYDYYTAIERGYIDENYFEWWGFEDIKLFDIATKELESLAAKGKPFNFTMLTVDPHSVGGYHCKKCENEYENDTLNVVKCADAQVYEFVEWIKKQDFYENTTIVITGDHLRMDTNLTGDATLDERRIYNCFINSVHKASDVNSKNRAFTTLDMFPTVLSAMGYEIEGNKLGLGINLFSDEKTLAEETSFNELNAELEKKSEYYLQTFAPEFLETKTDAETLAETAYVYDNDEKRS